MLHEFGRDVDVLSPCRHRDCARNEFGRIRGSNPSSSFAECRAVGPCAGIPRSASTGDIWNIDEADSRRAPFDGSWRTLGHTRFGTFCRPTASLAPAELPGGPSSVAVCTSDLALRNLCKHSRPRLVHRENDHVMTLRRWVPVIEVEYHDVRLAAVDARVTPKVPANERSVLVSISSNPRDLLRDVGVAIAHVVATPIGRVTLSAATLTRPTSFVMKREVGDWFDLAAVVATFGLGKNIDMRGLKGGDGHEEPLEVRVGPSSASRSSRTLVLSHRNQKSKRVMRCKSRAKGTD